ncbi:unannotated protein [freshwater metagenome]|uniref:Unannotated protein n=1 Tax=freshwater metagenome TaxID=449393 RepID=A0A6J7K3Z8_9ZZZZ
MPESSSHWATATPQVVDTTPSIPEVPRLATICAAVAAPRLSTWRADHNGPTTMTSSPPATQDAAGDVQAGDPPGGLKVVEQGPDLTGGGA